MYIYIYICIHKSWHSDGDSQKTILPLELESHVSLAGVKPSTFGFGLVISHCNDDSNGIGYLERLSGTGLKHLYVL